MKNTISGYAVRVYGIMLNEEREKLLIAEESIDDFSFTKFPGGGAEPGESVLETLTREFKEETGLEIEIGKLIYVTDFCVESKFLPGMQVLGIYYLVKAKDSSIKSILTQAEKDFSKHEIELKWISKEEIFIETFTFKSDQKAWEAFQKLECC